MPKLGERADAIAQLSSALTAGLSIGCGGMAYFDGSPAVIAVLGTLGGICSAIAVWATGAASKLRDERLDAALRFSLSASQRLDAAGPQL